METKNEQGIKVINSTEKKSKIIGKCGTRNQKNGESFLKGSICFDFLSEEMDKYSQIGTNGKRYFNVIIVRHLSGIRDKHGNTHLILALKQDKSEINFDDL